MEVRKFSEECVDDAVRLVQECGLLTTAGYLQSHLLANPNLSCLADSSAGVVIFEEAKCVAFTGLALRKLYLCQVEMLGVEATVLAIDKESSHVVGELIEAIMRPRGQAICYANTCMPKAVRLWKIAGMRTSGPASCEKIQFFVTRWGTFLGLALLKKGKHLPSFLQVAADTCGQLANRLYYRRHRSNTVSVRTTSIDDKTFERFWEEYVSGNDGVVTSRSPKNLKWLFGEGLTTGRFVMIVRKRDDRIAGYVILKKHEHASGLRWMIADWIALNNAPDVLHDLLLDARRFAATTDAFCLELTGFPMSIQPTVKACLPFARKAVCNTFLYKLFDDSLKEALQKTPDKGWFWGPMDGDRCVN